MILLFTNAADGVARDLELLADSGYQGITKLHDRSRTPKKRSKKV